MIYDNTIFNADCFEVMKNIKDKVFDVAFTSPPYNRTRNDTYEHFDDIAGNYYDMLCTLTNELLRITKKDVIINIQQNYFNKVDFFKWLGFFAEKIKGVIVWEKTNPQPATNLRDETFSVTNAIEYFIVFSNNPNEFRANNKIKNIITTSVNSEHFEGHGAVMKLCVAEHFIINFTKVGDLVFDPFFGMGTTGVACKKNKRNYCGCEIVEVYKKEAEKRIKSLPLEFEFQC